LGHHFHVVGDPAAAPRYCQLRVDRQQDSGSASAISTGRMTPPDGWAAEAKQFPPPERSALRCGRPPPGVNRRLVEKRRRAGVVVVLLDRELGAFPARSDLDHVGVHNSAGGYRLADHLLMLGCRDRIFAMRPRSASTVNARIAGSRWPPRGPGGADRSI